MNVLAEHVWQPARVNGDSWRLIIHSPGAWYVAHGANELAQWHQYLSFPCASVCVCAGLRQWAERHNGSDLQCHLHGGQAIICGCLTCISESEGAGGGGGGGEEAHKASQRQTRPAPGQKKKRDGTDNKVAVTTVAEAEAGAAVEVAVGVEVAGRGRGRSRGSTECMLAAR